MPSNSCKKLWVDNLKKGHSDLVELSTWDPFENWERCRMPESAAWDELNLGFELLYSGVDDKLSRMFLNRALRVANRTLKEGKCRADKWTRAMYPMNDGHTKRAKVYAQALLGKKFDTKLLLSAVDDIEAFCETDGAGSWIFQAQAWYLAAVRSCMIAGDLTRAAEMMDAKPPFDDHKKQAGLLRRIIQVAQQEQPISDKKLIEAYKKYFDRIRSPKYKGRSNLYDQPDEERFENGVIHYKFFKSKDGIINWAKAIEGIGR